MSDDDKPIGRARGGLARADALSPERRKEISDQGVEAKRELATLPMATHGSSDHPLRIGEIELPCYVIEGDTRVLSQRGLQTSIGMSASGGGKSGEQRLVTFLLSLAEKTSEDKDLSLRIRAVSDRLKSPIKFRLPGGGSALGHEATILADICDVILAARKIPSALQAQQRHIAEQAELLVRGFARVGIIALVDEATGFQADRAANSLARILEAFIAKELQPWVKTFPSDYYEHLFRLRGLDYQKDTPKRPQYFGVLTNDIVYRRLAPGVLDELKRVSKGENGRPKHKLFQKLTQNVGYPKLREHLGSIVTLMKLSDTYSEFKSKLDHIHPPFGKTLPLPFDQTEDDGKGL